MLSNTFPDKRTEYVFGLIAPKPRDKILNIGLSNIPSLEQLLETRVRECWSIDIDEEKLLMQEMY